MRTPSKFDFHNVNWVRPCHRGRFLSAPDFLDWSDVLVNDTSVPSVVLTMRTSTECFSRRVRDEPTGRRRRSPWWWWWEALSSVLLKSGSLWLASEGTEFRFGPKWNVWWLAPLLALPPRAGRPSFAESVRRINRSSEVCRIPLKHKRADR